MFGISIEIWLFSAFLVLMFVGLLYAGGKLDRLIQERRQREHAELVELVGEKTIMDARDAHKFREGSSDVKGKWHFAIVKHHDFEGDEVIDSYSIGEIYAPNDGSCVVWCPVKSSCFEKIEDAIEIVSWMKRDCMMYPVYDFTKVEEDYIA